MKKILSSILLIGLLLSMLIVPVSAEESTLPNGVTWSDPENVALGATVPARPLGFTPSGYGFSLTESDKAVDGSRGYYITGTTTASTTRLGIAKSVLGNLYFDIDGNKYSANASGAKYQGYLTYQFAEAATVEVIRLYLGRLLDNGKPHNYMPNGLDVAISATGEAGSWKIVYSATKIADDGLYQIYENEDGQKTPYIEAQFMPTEAKFVRIAIVDPSSKFATSADEKRYFYINEIEVYSASELVLPEGATWGDSKNVSMNKATISTTNVDMGSNKAPLSNLIDSVLDNSVAKAADNAYTQSSSGGKVSQLYLHYVDARLHDGNTYGSTVKKRYDLAGNLAAPDATHKYLCFIDLDLKKTQYIDNIKVYLDALDVANAKGDQLLVNGFDLLVSEDGRNWTTVYSETGIRTEDKYLLRDNEGLNDKGETAQQAWINVDFDITAARYVRFALTEARDTTKYWRLSQLDVYGRDVILPVSKEEEAEETGINSLMLFPLLMRHRQYETETTTTMFGLRVKHLLRSADSITFEKNGVKVDIPAATLKALNLAGSDKLVVTIEGEKVSATVNGKEVDLEGIASSTPAEEEEEIKGTLYRWDFDDLNEKNGKANLTDSAASTKAYTVADGVITTTDRTTDFKMSDTITLTPNTDWSIEWKVQMAKGSMLFGNESSKNNVVYLNWETEHSNASFNHTFRMVDSNGKVLYIPYGTYTDCNTEMNTWKVEYSSINNYLTLKFLNEATQEWETVGGGTPPVFHFDLTHMFGRYSAGVDVCFKGVVDYVEVYINN